MKKLLLLLVLAALGIALTRRLSAPHRTPGHMHGTPDHWPPVIRKSERTETGTSSDTGSGTSSDTDSGTSSDTVPDASSDTGSGTSGDAKKT